MSDGRIYFIEDRGRAIKIGFSRDLGERFAILQKASAVPLSVIGSVHGTFDGERFLHTRLGAHRLNGEWFKDCPVVRDCIATALSDGLSALGYCEPNPLQADPETEGVTQARALSEIILRYARPSEGQEVSQFLRRFSVEIGLKSNLLWSLRYRPPKDVLMGDLRLLRQVALRLASAAAEQAEEDEAVARKLIEDEAELLRALAEIDAAVAAAAALVRTADEQNLIGGT